MIRALIALLAIVMGLACLGGLYWNTHAERQAARVAALTVTATAAQPLITAINTYRQKRGGPPPTLAALIPTYLMAVPGPGPAAKGGWIYEVDPLTKEWSLRIAVRADLSPNMWLGFGDTFEYRPTGNYPREAYGGILVPFGKWGYYVE